jgi:putative membrane protein
LLRTALIASVLLAASSESSLAHGAADDRLSAQWSLDPLVSTPLVIAGLLYARGYVTLRVRLGRGPAAIPWSRLSWFVLGEFVIALALLSPLDAASGTLLSAHMVQHVLLVAVAPPLLLAGRPEAMCFWGLPEPWRRPLARSRPARAVLRSVGALARPLPASVLHGAALWLWHTPVLFEAAEVSASLHALEHACFFGTAVLFWRAVLAAARDPAAALGGAAAALVMLIVGGFLGALIGLSPSLIYPVSTREAAAWGLTPLEDQQLAGAIMWVPAGAAYLVAGLALAACAIAPRSSRGPAPLRRLSQTSRIPKPS